MKLSVHMTWRARDRTAMTYVRYLGLGSETGDRERAFRAPLLGESTDLDPPPGVFYGSVGRDVSDPPV